MEKKNSAADVTSEVSDKAPPPEAPEFPSVDDACPHEQGGPIARIGFSYQDEVAVSFLLEMLRSSSLLKVHCETHDDILLVRDLDGCLHAEFVQVKAGAIDKLWSVADLCRRDTGVGTLADLQPDGEQHACLLHFLGLGAPAPPSELSM